MSLSALYNAQSPLFAQSSASPSALPSKLPQAGYSSEPSVNDRRQPIVVEVSNISHLEEERDSFLSSGQKEGTEWSPIEWSAIEGLILSVRSYLDKAVAAIYLDSRLPRQEEDSQCFRKGLKKDDAVEADPRNTQGWRCRWFGACSTIYWQTRAATAPDQRVEGEEDDEAYLYDTGFEDKRSPDDWQHDNRTMSEIPQYVLDYAPYVHLFSGEQFWPCHIAEHLHHITPNLNYTPILSRTANLNLTNLDDLNEYENGRFVYLKSDDNVEERPDWLGGQKNIPDEPEKELHRANILRHPHQKPDYTQTQQPPRGGRSSAPAVLITVNKGHGIVDAFWFYFYSYNLGNIVLNIRFGNHIGDWEHSLVRFQHGKPKIVFFSEHFFGQAYTYDAVEKIGQRPVVYSAVGTHAMYARPGLHPYILPLGLLHDQTDRGPLWDPLLNSMSYTYDVKNDTLRPSNLTKNAPTEWFFFNGHWGDKIYSLDDSRQYEFAGQYHYVTGPLGPRFKHLGRRKVCQGPYSNKCEVKQWLDAEGEGEIPIWPGPGEGEGEGEDTEHLYDFDSRLWQKQGEIAPVSNDLHNDL